MSSDQTPPGAEVVRDVRVTSYPGQSTGWAAMSQGVRGFDEEKVQRCKEDVDTLLVFAGLFSAVLSAFLVAAYPNLQPSPVAMMAYQLERIGNQTMSYNFTDGKLIATTISPPPDPFQVSPEDIRVNTLWFVSLILSLMTASFGMLVKQWLREFLAVDLPSAEARLRIRHFREPHLQTWMVYEIVACLPLLLQLSLGLFFVGLCYFTASVHESMGHTTFPLVVGWALVFFGATALPIFFPCCPYRTTLLKTGIAHLHHKLSSLALKLSLVNIPVTLHWPMLSPVVQAIVGYASSLPFQIASVVLKGSHHIRVFILSVLPRLSPKQWHVYMAKLYNSSLERLRKLPSEEHLAKDGSSDVEILKTVDAIQANDDILDTTFRDALQYIHPKPPYKEIVTFILEVLSHRLPTLPAAEHVLPEWPFDGFAPLSSLRPQARTAVSNIIADHTSGLQYYRSNQRPDYTIVIGADQQKFTSICGLTLVLSLFASDQEPKLSSDTLLSIRSCLEERVTDAMIQDVLLLTTSKGKKNIWENGTKVLTSLTRIWKLAKSQYTLSSGTKFFEAIQSELAKLQQRPDEDFGWNSWSWPENAPQEFQNACVRYLCTVVTAAPEHHNLQDQNSQKSLRNILACSSRLIRTHFSYFRSGDAEQSFQQLITFVMKSKLTVNMVITCWMSADDAWKGEYDQEMIDYVARYSYDLPQPLESQDLELLSSVITDQLSRCSKDLTQSLKFCYHIIYLLLLLQAKTAGVEKCRELFALIISHIQSLFSGQVTERSREETTPPIEGHEDQQQASDATKLVNACLDLMAHEHGRGYYLYEDWKDYSQADSSIFPDDLVETLGKLIVRQHGDKLYRLRELEERRQAKKNLGALVELKSDEKGKDISGRLAGVGNTDQEDSANDKTMEIYDTREGLVGLAVGDDRSVGFEGVTRIQDVAKALHLPTSDGTTPSTGSGHNAQATASVSTRAHDQISGAPNEEVNKLEVKATTSDAPATPGHVLPHKES